MMRTRTAVAAGLGLAAAVLVLAGGAATAREPKDAGHVAEVKALLSNLTIEKPRTHKNMVVFPIRYGGKQAPGRWITLDEAEAAGELKVSEKDQASVPEVLVQNTGNRTVFVMSGEIIKGGKQTRVVQKDTIIEPKQKVAIGVFCVERSRWAGGKEFKGADKMVPASVRGGIQRGEGQGEVWGRVRATGAAAGAESPTESLDEMMESAPVKQEFDRAHKNLGKFSPPDTVGIAVADARTGRVVGLELFGRRDLFERLQDKLVEGYAMDLVVTQADWKPGEGRRVTEDEVAGFITRAIQGTSRYEDTPGSGRGLDLESGTLKGKGVALGDCAIHLSVQDSVPAPAPARPIIEDPRPMRSER
jgi:hypothetical protein